MKASKTEIETGQCPLTPRARDFNIRVSRGARESCRSCAATATTPDASEEHHPTEAEGPAMQRRCHLNRSRRRLPGKVAPCQRQRRRRPEKNQRGEPCSIRLGFVPISIGAKSRVSNLGRKNSEKMGRGPAITTIAGGDYQAEEKDGAGDDDDESKNH